jgi:hypothetical protein
LPQEKHDTPAPHVAAKPDNPQAPEPAPHADTVLQVNLKMPSPAPLLEPPPMKQATLPAMPEVPVTPAPTAPPGTTVLAPAAATPAAHRPEQPAATATPVAAPPEPPEPTTHAQPLKSVTLEFAPDGAGDVKLRVTERAGEVHISLHSSDTSLGGKLHEGVHDLVGSLSKAGYEADAWTPGQGHSGNQRQQEERKHVPTPEDPDAEEFSGVYDQQATQEVL